MEVVGIIALSIVVLVGVAVLWRSTSSESPTKSASDQDRMKDTIVDYGPSGSGGSGN